jgi:MFS family permease
MKNNNKPRLFYGWIIVISCFFIMAATLGSNNTFGVFLEPMLDEFGWTRAMTSGAFSICVVISAVLCVLAGRLNDRYGPRVLIAVSGVLFSAGYILMASVHTLWQFYLFYGGFTGLALTVPTVITSSTIARWFTKRRLLMTGVVLAGINIGTIILSQIANAVILNQGWRTAFVYIGIICFVIVVPLAFVLKRDPASTGQFPHGTSQPLEIVKTANSGYTLRETMSTGYFWMLCTILFFLGVSIFSTITQIVIYATGIGILQNSAVTLLTVIAITCLSCRLILGAAGDRVGSRSVMLFTIIMATAAFVWLPFTRNLWTLTIFALLLGVVWGGFVAVSPLAADMFGLRYHGTIFGLLHFTYSMGCAVGPILAGFVYDKTGSYQQDFILLAVLNVISLVLMMFIRRRKTYAALNNV